MTIAGDDQQPERVAAGSDYVVVCDALIYAPFYAVNIRSGSSYYSEVIMAMEETAATPLLAAPNFEAFAAALLGHPDKAWLFP